MDTLNMLVVLFVLHAILRVTIHYAISNIGTDKNHSIN